MAQECGCAASSFAEAILACTQYCGASQWRLRYCVDAYTFCCQACIVPRLKTTRGRSNGAGWRMATHTLTDDPFTMCPFCCNEAERVTTRCRPTPPRPPQHTQACAWAHGGVLAPQKRGERGAETRDVGRGRWVGGRSGGFEHLRAAIIIQCQ